MAGLLLTGHSIETICTTAIRRRLRHRLKSLNKITPYNHNRNSYGLKGIERPAMRAKWTQGLIVGHIKIDRLIKLVLSYGGTPGLIEFML